MNESAPIGPSRFWWEDCPIERVAPFDYPPARIAAARQRIAGREGRIAPAVRAIMDGSRNAEEAVRGIARWVQDALVHPPLYQPAETTFGYWWWRRLAPTGWSGWPRLAQRLGQRLVLDSELLVELGEGRCGQSVAVLCDALRLAGFKAALWQLPHHMVVEVVVAGECCVIDVDAFKHGIMLEVDGRIARKREVEEDPYLVDGFKPTGWMFRRDSRYARRGSAGPPYRGYVDFYSPEEDGQISARYGAPTVLKPPGVPRWVGVGGSLTVGRGRPIEVSCVSRHAGRARGYRFRCGRRSRGYAYDALDWSQLAGETSSEILALERPEPAVSFRLQEPGRYFLTAAAVPDFLEKFPSYIWWSDELIIDVE